MDILIVGAGRMGRWFGRTLRERDREVTLAFADADPAVATAAAEAVGGRAVALDGDGTFEAVCLAVPIPAIAEAVAAQAPRAGEAVCDLAGAMEPAVTAMADHAPELERLSLHPLFAPGNAPGTVAAVGEDEGRVAEAIRAALSAAGNRVVDTTPAEHDEAMETVQARAHAAVLAFALAAEEVPEWCSTPVSAGLAELVETVTGGDPRVYADVQATFSGAADVAAAAERVAAADRETFAELYREAGPDGGDRP
jgi:prephenate dehydrogenase